MADLNEILYGRTGNNPQIGAPQVPPGMLQQTATVPATPPAQFTPAVPFQQGGGYPPVAPQTQAPPEDPNAFSSLVQKVQSDPALSQAAMMMGIRLAQGARPGQNTLGLLGDTAMMGVSAYQMLEGNKRAQGMEDVAFRNTQDSKVAAAEGQVLQNTEAKATLPAMVKAKIAKAGMLERAGKVDEAESVVAEARAQFRKHLATSTNSSVLQQSWMDEIKNAGLKDLAELQLRQAQTEVAYASAGSSGASAEAARALAALRRAQTDTPERFRTTPTSAASAKLQELRDSYAITHPDLSEAQREKLARQDFTKARGNEKIEMARNQYINTQTEMLGQLPTPEQIRSIRASALSMFPDGADASGAAQASAAQTFTMEQAQALAKRHGKPLAQVVKDAQARGWTLAQ